MGSTDGLSERIKMEVANTDESDDKDEYGKHSKRVKNIFKTAIIVEDAKVEMKNRIERDKKELELMIEDGGQKGKERFEKYIRENTVGLQTLVEKKDEGKEEMTMMKKIIEEVSDGSEIVEQILNSYVTSDAKDPKIVRLDFSQINEYGRSVVSDLVDLSMQHSESFLSIFDPIKSIFTDLCQRDDDDDNDDDKEEVHKSKTSFNDVKNSEEIKSKACKGKYPSLCLPIIANANHHTKYNIYFNVLLRFVESPSIGCLCCNAVEGGW